MSGEVDLVNNDDINNIEEKPPSEQSTETIKDAGKPEQEPKNEDKPPSKTDENTADYDKNVTYDEKGIAIYTDPTTQYQYTFDNEKNEWVPKDGKNQSSNPYENEHYRWCTESNQWILKESADSVEGKLENEHYKWDAESQKWIPKNKDQKFASSEYKDGQHLYTDSDGAVYFWDTEKNAWFPKIDDDFMAVYQMNYGFIDNTSTPEGTGETSTKTSEKAAEAPKSEAEKPPTAKRKANDPQWFEEAAETCTKVYVSNLPEDITEEEFVELMSKCGMVMRDPHTKKWKVKLYAEPSGQLKGDGLCHYIRVESVQLALDMLDGYDVHGRTIKVERAKFQMRGEYNPKLKPKKKKKDKEKMKKMQEKLLAWKPEPLRGERPKHERVVILKNLFTPETFDNKVDLIIDYHNMVRDECAKCGKVKKVIIYSSDPEGVAEIRMNDAEEADLVVQMMHKRFFGQRTLTAELWDGQTKFKANETEAEATDRLSKWDEFLEKGDDDDEDDKKEPAQSKERPQATTTNEEINGSNGN